ncbi:MAG: cellulose biosynthesis protein BcsG [Elusimicrobia bacterium]|nr:cellulose biosynthesis protein BcsG [Elusimicrobiota bacterium]
MLYWNFYFLAKFYLHFREHIHIHFGANLVLIIFLLIFSAMGFFRKLPKKIQFILSIFVAISLLWYESWLPPFRFVFQFLTDPAQRPSKEYMVEFLRQALNPLELLLLIGLGVLCCLAYRKRVRLTPFVLVFLFMTPLYGSSPNLNSALDQFFRLESKRVVHFSALPASPDFDIVLLHVCSLSWDDLKAVGLQNDSFFSQFDYLLTQFNTVTGYSNPAAYHLLRANCGQSSHDRLYTDVSRECYMMENLRGAGYRTYTVFNHDGKYSEMAKGVVAQGKADPMMEVEGLPAEEYNFDNSPIYNNYAILKRWWELRQSHGSKRAVVYYNSITLHDGARRASQEKGVPKPRSVMYKEFAQSLFRDLERFFDLLSSSNRNVVVVFVPEHGAALQGTKIQTAGLREIPLPQITTVPVGIKFIGKGYVHLAQKPKTIDKPVSYLAIAHLLASFLKISSFAERGAENAFFTIPETGFMAENQHACVLKSRNGFFYRGKQKKWIKLPNT